MTSHRYQLFDHARGLAIILMIMANSAPLLAADVAVSFWFRLLSSLPAPVFVVVAGAMVAVTASKHDFWYFVRRGIFIMLMGAFVDIFANTIVPFQSCDVLYLIGMLMPVAYFANRLPNAPLILLISVLVGLSALLRFLFGYHSIPLMTELSQSLWPSLAKPIWRHWLIDGWFPLLPWLPLGLTGILFMRFYRRANGQNFITTKFIFAMMLLVIIGATLTTKSPFYTRYGYVELFYPPTIGLVIAAIGAVGLVFVAAQLTQKWSFSYWSRLLGSMSLSIYALHLLIIAHVLTNLFFPVTDWAMFVLIFIGHLAVIFSCAFFLTAHVVKIVNI